MTYVFFFVKKKLIYVSLIVLRVQKTSNPTPIYQKTMLNFKLKLWQLY